MKSRNFDLCKMSQNYATEIIRPVPKICNRGCINYTKLYKLYIIYVDVCMNYTDFVELIQLRLHNFGTGRILSVSYFWLILHNSGFLDFIPLPDERTSECRTPLRFCLGHRRIIFSGRQAWSRLKDLSHNSRLGLVPS